MLTGIRMEIEGEHVVLAATDRYRLAVRELAWAPDRTDASAVALVQARSLADTARALADADRVDLALATGGTGEGILGFAASVAGGTRRSTTRLLDGEFPKYRALLPAEQQRRGCRRRPRRSPRRSSACRWWPSATPRSGCRFSRR